LYNDDEAGLFAGMEYDQDDEEADKIYESIDEKMDERRRKWR
jgi:pre-mRNA-processing factor 6